jgi:hypothetical protein
MLLTMAHIVYMNIIYNKMTKLQRNTVLKWVTLGLGLLMAVIQLIKYSFGLLMDFETEKYFCYIWLSLLFSPFVLPIIISKFSKK